MLSFMQSPRYYFTSESVTEGHPDKICDQVSDSILDEYLRIDPEAHVACETAITGGMVLVFGEVSAMQSVQGSNNVAPATMDVERVVRRTIEAIGYNTADRFFDARTCGVS